MIFGRKKWKNKKYTDDELCGLCGGLLAFGQILKPMKNGSVHIECYEKKYGKSDIAVK